MNTAIFFDDSHLIPDALPVAEHSFCRSIVPCVSARKQELYK